MKSGQSIGETRFQELEAEYEILGELGRGGTAVVYRARERELGRDVAIKVVRANDDAEAVARLAREAKLVAALRHPNVVPLLGIKHLADGLALIMQHVPGRTLKRAIREDGQLPIPFVEHVLREIASALDYAHKRHGIIHRDIKPENIYLDEEVGRALLSDFGIARTTEGESTLTLVGTALGTPAYMSPEQIDGSLLDGRSDLYSLGLVAYEMLTGQQPWAGCNLYTIIYKQKNEELPAVTNFRKDVPSYLLRALESLLRKDAVQRCPDAAQFIAQLPGVPVSAPSFTPAPRQPEPVVPTVSDDSPTIRYQRPAAIEVPLVMDEQPAEVAPAPAPLQEIPVSREPDPAIAAVAAAMAAAGQTVEVEEEETPETPVLELPRVRPNWHSAPVRGRGLTPAVYAQPEVAPATELSDSDVAILTPVRSRRTSQLVAALTALLVLGGSATVVAMMNDRDEPASEEIAESPASQRRTASANTSLKSSGVPENTQMAGKSPTNAPATSAAGASRETDAEKTATQPLPVPNVQLPNVQVPTIEPQPVGSRVSASDFTSAGVIPTASVREASVSSTPTFTPYTVQPELRNRTAVQGALRDNYPRVLRERNIGGPVRLWVLIDTAGNVIRSEVQESSGNEILDRAASRVATVMQFTPAMNRDRKVSVWLQLPVVFKVQP